ncbi:P-loop containing nucleoside triphosphate hydrolase protein [Macrolepiota fuliginosa MF-IS2]|uniref:P-loop containing nucleoside triphosphate hydrolase protein n=1 Tax=Macrolepiota fuliginosa MF-IS2 TaxID=1400762 RepID=A0A9P6C5L8_9AGAR|nr:P-loop containing nucleoside triphosphate hydrolase protein [Macrolepiota fuliginosa MF-IS2]
MANPKMDDTFVNVWLDSNESIDPQKKPFYKLWIDKASAQHSDPALTGADTLRKLYPEHSLVSTSAYDLHILSYPGLTATPLPSSPLITEVLFAPFARSLHSVPGVLIDQVKLGAFQVTWNGFEFLLYLASYPSGFGMVITQSYILHEGPEERARLLLMSVGAWAHELHNEIWVFNQGFWSKDRGLWEEIQKANWNDVILKEDFKKALQKDVYGFFSAEEIYKKLSIPWKRGLIMYGPPGNGKTISIKAIMKSCNENGFLPLYVKSFQSKSFSPRHIVTQLMGYEGWKGEEGAIADVFDQARQMSPSCLILEDLDSLINDRNRSFFLNQLDGLEGNNGLLIIGTTNHFDRLDPGLSSRPSRFDRKYLFDDPDPYERALYARYWQQKLSGNSEIDFPESLIGIVVESTAGFSFAYLKEAFVSTLVTLAGISGDKPSFEKVLKEQINDLRKQLDEESPGGSRAATQLVHTTQTPLQQPPTSPTSIRHNQRDVRILLDALNDRISRDDSHLTFYDLHEKFYAMLQPEPQQLDADARRVRTLLDSLSESVANMSTSPRVYRPFVSHGVQHDIESDAGVGKSGDVSGGSSQFHSQDAMMGNKAYQRRLPTPPGPPGIGGNRPLTSGQMPPGSFIQSQPTYHPRSNPDANDLA